MPTLENEIRGLEMLNDIRDEMARYRDEARKALTSYLSADQDTRTRDWQAQDIHGDTALILKALCHEKMDRTVVKELVIDLGTLEAIRILGTGKSSVFIGKSEQELTILATARILAGLTSPETSEEMT